MWKGVTPTCDKSPSRGVLPSSEEEEEEERPSRSSEAPVATGIT